VAGSQLLVEQSRKRHAAVASERLCMERVKTA
jgi:hypothetical protein